MKKSKLILWIISFIPLIVNLFLYSKLPQQIPLHWDINGIASYENKYNIFIIAVIPILLTFLFNFLPKIDPKHENYKKFQESYTNFKFFMIIFLIVLNFIILSESFNPGKIPVDKAVILLIGILFLYIGNMMPKIKHNFFMGVKNPWTLSDSNIWNKTNRLFGILMFISGVLIIIFNFILPSYIMFGFFITLILLIVFASYIMSYIWYKNANK